MEKQNIRCHQCEKKIIGFEGKDFHNLRHTYCDHCVNPYKYLNPNFLGKPEKKNKTNNKKKNNKNTSMNNRNNAHKSQPLMGFSNDEHIERIANVEFKPLTRTKSSRSLTSYSTSRPSIITDNPFKQDTIKNESNTSYQMRSNRSLTFHSRSRSSIVTNDPFKQDTVPAPTPTNESTNKINILKLFKKYI